MWGDWRRCGKHHDVDGDPDYANRCVDRNSEGNGDSKGENEKKKKGRHITRKPIREIIEMMLNAKADGWGTVVEMLHRGSSVTRLSMVGGYEMVGGNVGDMKASSVERQRTYEGKTGIGGQQREEGGISSRPAAHQNVTIAFVSYSP